MSQPDQTSPDTDAPEPAREGRVMQKLLWPRHADQIASNGISHVFGPVVARSDVAEITDPAALLDAYGLTELAPYGPEPTHVDVLRYRAAPLMRHEIPDRQPVPRPWPQYDLGFLRTRLAVVPVWSLDTTRVPAGTQMWRLSGDGEQLLTEFRGPAAGWARVPAWSPPFVYAGPRAEWHGREWVADFGAEDRSFVELVAFGDVPDGFTPARPGVSHRMVPRAECDRLFTVDLRHRWRGVPGRLLHAWGQTGILRLDDDDPETAVRVGAWSPEPGVFEVQVALADLQTGTVPSTSFELPAP